MPPVFSWLKRELIYMKDSFKEILKGFIVFALASSGLVAAILLRYFGFNGTVITFYGLVIEFVSLFLCYFILKDYIKFKEDQDKSEMKEKTP